MRSCAMRMRTLLNQMKFVERPSLKMDVQIPLKFQYTAHQWLMSVCEHYEYIVFVHEHSMRCAMHTAHYLYHNEWVVCAMCVLFLFSICTKSPRSIRATINTVFVESKKYQKLCTRYQNSTDAPKIVKLGNI